jgi:arsenate reductase-like glutaredoxin family protein
METKEQLIAQLAELKAREELARQRAIEQKEINYLKSEIRKRKHPVMTNVINGFRDLFHKAGTKINELSQDLNSPDNSKRSKTKWQ